jgi:hypothetical protein
MNAFRTGARTLLAATLVMTPCIATTTFAAPASAAAAPARVTIVHGVRGLVADIWLDGKKVLPSFQPERATDPIPIPAGAHRVEIRGAGAAGSSVPLLAQDLVIPADADLTVVAHLNPAGAPALSVYRERSSKVPAGRARIVVRHAAAVAAIAVELDQRPLLASVEPGTQAFRDVAPGTHAVSITEQATDGGAPLLAPKDLPLDEGSGIVLYLIGSQKDSTLSWLAQPVRAIGAGATVPSRIVTGDSGLRSERDDSWLPLAALALTGVVLPFVRRRQADR